MSDLELLQQQISAQIVNMYTFDVSYTDADNEAFRVIHAEDGYYVWPLFSQPKKVSRLKFHSICALSDDFITDTDQRKFTINGFFAYDEFMTEFYNSSPALPLESYIDLKHGTERGAKAKFAKKEGVQTPQITQWLEKEFIVVNGELYSPRRTLNK